MVKQRTHFSDPHPRGVDSDVIRSDQAKRGERSRAGNAVDGKSTGALELPHHAFRPGTKVTVDGQGGTSLPEQELRH